MADVETQRSFNTSQKSAGSAKKKASKAKEQASSQINDAESQAGTESVGGESQAIQAGSVDHKGNVVDHNGQVIGKVSGENASQFENSIVDDQGDVLDEEGNVIASAEPLEANSVEKPELSGPFGVQDNGEITNATGVPVGKLVEGEPQDLVGTSIKEIDEDGNLKAKSGRTVGKAELNPEVLGQGEGAVDGAASDVKEDVDEKELPDLSVLEGKKVNKAGNVVDENGKLFGRVVDGDAAKLVGKKVDAKGKIWSGSGKIIGSAELIPVDERDESSGAPFEDFPDAVVNKDGTVVSDGQVIGKLIDGDAKKLAGKAVDKDGEVLDKIGNVVGKAERWEEEDAPEPEAADLSALSGKRVNKLGNVTDSSGSIYGRLVEGDPKKLAGRMCDKDGNVRGEGGDIVGRAELVPESEREGQKQGPFSDFDGATVTKDGKVECKGTVIGRLVEGDAKKLFGKPVDEDGDVLDKNGNSLGRAERWEEPEKEKSRHAAAGRKVNKEGKVVDENGDTIAQLTDGDVSRCAGKEIDDEGDVIDGKGNRVGSVTLLADIPAPEEPKESPEEAEERKQLEQDKKLAKQMASCVQQSIDKIQPILKMITESIESAERQPKEELDEQKLVDTVKPLLEQGGEILQEANGVIRGLDPDGRIQANAKHKSASREATPEEHHLAELLKELAGNVSQTIDGAKKKIAGMPHAKKELNPLWGLLAEPLGQILAAVGLLLSGVLGLVGKLLSGLGLGGLLDNLLGGLGIKGILEGLGLGSITKSLTGKK